MYYSLIPRNTTKTTPKPAQSRAQSVPKSFRGGEVGLGRGWACVGDQLNYSLIPLNTTKATPKPAQSRAQSVPKSFREGEVGLGRGWEPNKLLSNTTKYVPKSFREGEVGLGRGWACIGDQLNYSLMPLNTTKTTPKPAQSIVPLMPLKPSQHQPSHKPQVCERRSHLTPWGGFGMH